MSKFILKLNHVLALNHFVSTDEARYNLHGFYVDVINNSLAATNGTSLLKIDNIFEDGEAPEKSCIIKIDSKQLAKFRSKDKELDRVEFDMTDKIAYVNEFDVQRVIFETIDADYPDYDKVILDDTKGVYSHKFCFNPEIYKKICAAAGCLYIGKQNPALRFIAPLENIINIGGKLISEEVGQIHAIFPDHEDSKVTCLFMAMKA